MLSSNKYLHFLILVYILATLNSWGFDSRQINVFGLTTGGGSLAFPFTYLIAGMITEIYGYKNTRIVIWTGLLFQALFLLYGKFVTHFLSSSSPHASVLSFFTEINNWIMLGGLATYLISETVNAYIISTLKTWLRGLLIGIRFIVAILIAYLVDELVYAPIAFHRFINHKQLLFHMLDSWVLMVVIELLMLPIAVRIAIMIKKREQIDIYDKITNFNPFSLDTHYRSEDNKYNKEDE